VMSGTIKLQQRIDEYECRVASLRSDLDSAVAVLAEKERRIKELEADVLGKGRALDSADRELHKLRVRANRRQAG